MVGNADQIVVSLQDGTQLPARLIGADELTDVAVIKVNASRPLPAAPFGDSRSVEVGDWVIAAGNPFGLGGSITAGIVSARGRDIGAGPFDDFIQIDAPINPGNSGGPVFNDDGQVVGMNTAIVLADRRLGRHRLRDAERTGAADRQRIARQRTDRPRLAWRLAGGCACLTARRRRRRRGSGAAGQPGGSGRAGTGDVIVTINGTPVEDARAVVERGRDHPAGRGGAPGAAARRAILSIFPSPSAGGRRPRRTDAMRILVVEDDKDVAGFVVKGLKEAGHVVEHAANGRDGLFMAASEEFDAIVLDRMLPGGVDGLRLLETLRGQDNNTPVLFLSAMAQVDDRVRGLKAGGDDYLTKPFAFAELLARVEALARRGKGEGPATKLVVGDLEMDLLSRGVKRAGQKIDLQPREFRLLEYLMRHAGQVVTRTMLLEGVWDYHFDPQTNVIDVHVSRLRQKVDKPFPDAADPYRA